MMNDPAQTLLRAGAEASMVEDFRALVEATAPNGAPRYRTYPLLEELARFLVRGANGPNRDAAFYELCHLVNAVDASGDGRDRRNTFFMGPEQALSRHFRARLDGALAKRGWRRPGFARTDEGIAIRYPDGDFVIRFSRMPFLAAVYEFLAGMEAFTFYPELQAIFDEMTRQAPDIKAIQAASNRIASQFRQYRRRHLAQTQQEGKFDLILGFLVERSPAGRVVIDDASVFDFWSEKHQPEIFAPIARCSMPSPISCGRWKRRGGPRPWPARSRSASTAKAARSSQTTQAILSATPRNGFRL